MLKRVSFMAFLLAVPTAALAKPASGCSFVVSFPGNQRIHEEGNCTERLSPMSSFKLPLAVMGYDAGILIDEQTPAWPYQEGYVVNKDNDRETTTPSTWEQNSVLWYSQKLTETLGMKRFQAYVDRFDYGNRDLSGHPGKQDGLTESWLMSSLKISPVEQVRFIRKLLTDGLGVSARAHAMTRNIAPEFKAGEWTVKGKTGSGWWVTDAEGNPDRSKPLGWFVGWAEKDGRKVIFARLIKGHQHSDVYGGMLAREDMLRRIPALLSGAGR